MKLAKYPWRTRHLVGQAPEEDEAVGHGERVGIGEIDLELADRILVVEGIDVPAEPVHRFDQIADPVEIVQQARDVIGRLVEMRLAADRRQPVRLGLAKDEELDLGAEIHAVAHLRGARPDTVEDVAAARLERRAPALQVGGEPGDVGLPGQDQARPGIGMGGDLLLVDLLRHPVERRPGEQLGAAHHLVEMRHRHHLGLGCAVHVGVARQQEADPALDQLRLQRGGIHRPLGRGRPVCESPARALRYRHRAPRSIDSCR